MNPSIAASNPNPLIPLFLDFIDRVGEPLGLNVPPIVDLEKLRSLPISTFGRTWADFLDRHNLPPITTGPRRKQLHDGVHVLTGYGTDPVGEAQIQAFLLGSKFRLAHVLLAVGLLGIIYKDLHQNSANQLNFSWDKLWDAYQRGQNSQFDVDSWQPELLWELPVTEVQALFCI